MNEIIINELSEELNIKKDGIKAVLKLLEEGNTELTDLREKLRVSSQLSYPID